MGTVLLTPLRPDSTDSLVIDSLPSGDENNKGKMIPGIERSGYKYSCCVYLCVMFLELDSVGMKKYKICNSPELLLCLWRPVRSEVGGGG